MVNNNCNFKHGHKMCYNFNSKLINNEIIESNECEMVGWKKTCLPTIRYIGIYVSIHICEAKCREKCTEKKTFICTILFIPLPHYSFVLSCCVGFLMFPSSSSSSFFFFLVFHSLKLCQLFQY